MISFNLLIILMICSRSIESLTFRRGVSSLFRSCHGRLRSSTGSESNNDIPSWKKTDSVSENNRRRPTNPVSQDNYNGANSRRKPSSSSPNSYTSSQSYPSSSGTERRPYTPQADNTSSRDGDRSYEAKPRMTGSRTPGAPSSTTNDKYFDRSRKQRPEFSREQKNEFYANEYGRENRGEPSYGYYDGDHVFGISPVRLALLSKKRKVTELLMQTGMDSNNKKDMKSVNEILNLCQVRR